MKNGFLTTLLVGAAVATMGIVTTQAATLDNLKEGQNEFDYIGFDSAQTSYTFANGTICSSVAGCDAVSPVTPLGAIGSEDTWGIALINSISQFSVGYLAPGIGGTDFLVAYFFGFDDFIVEGSGGDTIKTWSSGGHATIFRVSDVSAYITLRDAGPDDLTRAAFLLAYGGMEYLTLDFIAGCHVGVAGPKDAATLCGTFASDFASGNSTGFAMVTGGSAASQFNPAVPFFFDQGVVLCPFASQCNGSGGSPVSTDWTVSLDGTAIATVPEPGALGLLGLGLVGLGMIGRRRKAA